MRSENDHDIIRQHALDVAGVYQHEFDRLPDLPELVKNQWSIEFDMLCARRMVLGAFRYGCLKKQALTGNGRRNIDSLIERAEAFVKDGNLEHLCDIANIARVEYATTQHPLKHFTAGDDGLHTELLP